MKSAKVIIIVLLIFIIGSCGYIAVQPNSYDIQRSRVIKAPVELLFNQVNEFKNWENWSPWVEKEPDLQITYPKQTSGVGASYSWVGEDGPGSMKTLTVSPYDSISQEMQFGDFAPSNVYWKFEKADEGTKVTWGMKADEVPFILKFFSTISGGMDKMLGPDYERGLEKLDNLTIESMAKFEVTIDGITEYGGGFYVYKTTSANGQNISQVMGQQFGEIMNFMIPNKITPIGMPFTIYHTDMSQQSDNVIMSQAMPIATKVITPIDSNVLCDYIPKTKVLKATLKGNYTNLSKAWIESMAYITDNNLEQSGIKPFEIYTNDPGDFPNPSDWITEIYIPIKE